jgi:transposase
MDLRERVVRAVEEEGLSRRQAAERFGIGIKTAIDWVRRHRETGSVAAKPMGGCRPKKIIGQYRDWLLERCRVEDFTLRGLDIQKKTLVASERDRPDVARRRLQWMTYQDRIDPARLVFIDETWTKTNMAPLRGWAPCGQRLPGKAPHRRWKTMTFLAALRHDQVTAPWLIDGLIDGQSFLQYVDEVLVPTLKPGDIVILDNLGSHKGKAVRKAIRLAGAKLFFLPKYSPDLNPIEKFFAKLKHWLRRAARRTADAVHDAIAEILPLTSPDECSNYFTQAGYAQPQSITL